MFFDPLYFVMVAPALLLALWAQSRIRSAYGKAMQVPARLSGAAAARHVLDSAGLQDVGIEMIGGELSDHYDPRHKVLRLSQDVYHGHSMAAVGIAAHEAGHAIQDAQHYAPLVIRNLAVPVASIGSQFSMTLFAIGMFFARSGGGQMMAMAGVALFAGVVAFQLVNLPVEFNASSRAKAQLVELGVVPASEMGMVNRVLNAAALTYVAGTLQAILTLLYMLARLNGQRDR
ncbi:MAG: zinc metallopeptidase [Pirellulales bacterium]